MSRSTVHPQHFSELDGAGNQTFHSSATSGRPRRHKVRSFFSGVTENAEGALESYIKIG